MGEKTGSTWKSSSCTECDAACSSKNVDCPSTGTLYTRQVCNVTKCCVTKHNSESERHLKIPALLKDTCLYNECYRCKAILHKVRRLIEVIKSIEKKQAVKRCPNCRRPNPFGWCKRCQYYNTTNKLDTINTEDSHYREEHFNSLILKINDLLRGILQCGNIGQHSEHDETTLEELKVLLRQLNPPAYQRQPHVSVFPRSDSSHSVSIQSLVQSKGLLLDLLSQIKGEGHKKLSSAHNHYSITSSCMCKQVKDKKETELILPGIKSHDRRIRSREKQNASEMRRNEGGVSPSTSTPKAKTESSQLSKGNKSQDKEKPPKKDTSPKRDKSPRLVKSAKSEKPAKEPKSGKRRGSTSEAIIKMLKEREKAKKKERSPRSKPEKVKEPNIAPLPELKMKWIKPISPEVSESVLECEANVLYKRKEMVKGNRVTTFDPLHNVLKPSGVVPILFHAEDHFQDEEIEKESVATNTPSPLLQVSRTLDKPLKGSRKPEDDSNKGVILYALSDRQFIDNGWTVLPTEKLIKKVSVYKMMPSSSNWFEQNKRKKIMFYDSGEKLAEIDENGTGRWYYRNGIVALNYYNSEDLITHQRYVVYSSGEEVVNGKNVPISIMAAFDFLGNGVVYDYLGNERLKYNQSEGELLDDKIGPPGRWRWHSLKSSMKLQSVLIDTYDKNPDPDLEQLMVNSESRSFVKELQEDMLAIEFDNFVREKAEMFLQKFKRFDIRSKIFKINSQFTLHVINQSNIYLTFRDGMTSMKLNIGMVLKNDEIVDTDECDVSYGSISTPYDQTPAKTQSLADIHSTVNRVRKIGKTLENRQAFLKQR